MIIDLTHTITSEIPMYPGAIAPAFKAACTMTKDGYRETHLTLASHTGTHMDAPSHMISEGATLDVLPPSQFCGRATIVDVSDYKDRYITADFLRSFDSSLGLSDFVLFYTGWEKRWGFDCYFEDTYPVPDAEASKYLVSCGLKGVGIDTLSMDPLAGPCYPAHRILLGGGLVIMENLCLRKLVGRTDVMFFALPLKYEHADGAPIRAIAEFRDFSDKDVKDQ